MAIDPAVLGERPDEVALRDERTELTWAQVDGLLDRLVHVLDAHDLGPSRRVAVMADNSAETVLAHAAVILAGCSAVPVSASFTAPEAAYLLEVSGARLVLCGPSTRERVVAAAGAVPVLSWRSDGSWEQALGAASPAPASLARRPLPPLMFTSGTTGRPKAVDLPPTMFPPAADVPELLGQLAANYLVGLGPHLVVGPLHHTGPLQATRVLLCGTPVVVAGRFEASRVLCLMQEHQIASSVMVPTHFVRLLALPAEVRAAFDPTALRVVGQTGASCPTEVKRAMIDWWGPVFMEAYGATEVGTVASITSQEWLEHPGSVGRAVAPFEAVVLDEQDQPVGPGVSGRLHFRDTTGRGMVYAHLPEGGLPSQPVEPGLFTLGEIGHVDEDGWVYITDRASDMVVSGGVNVYPAEVEQVLCSHPAVHDAAGIGVPDDEMGERLVVLVVPAGSGQVPLDVDALLAHCRAQLAGYKCPRELVVVDELPRTTMGKLDKRALRAAHLAGVG